MAFLDNSGDIILDAVLTDTGRMRLAKGNGSFRIVKFALGDDEIDYELFNSSHASGSAYYDLEIMQTPVLEAFTNNTSSMKHKLLSIPQTNLLYLSTMVLNDQIAPAAKLTQTAGDITAAATTSGAPGTGIFIVTANTDTRTSLQTTAAFTGSIGVLDGSNHIRVDQGQNTEDISFTEIIDSELKETQYIVHMDHRLLRLTDSKVSKDIVHSYVDDDKIASYYISSTDELVKELRDSSDRNSTDTLGTKQVIKGPAGTYVEFNVRPTTEIRTRDSLFDELGSTVTVNTTEDFKYIDTNVRITGATTGSSLDIPVRVMRHYTTP
jgi:hypothetical protein